MPGMHLTPLHLESGYSRGFLSTTMYTCESIYRLHVPVHPVSHQGMMGPEPNVERLELLITAMKLL